MNFPSTRALFGEQSYLNSRRKYNNKEEDENRNGNDDDGDDNASVRPTKGTVTNFFFGFMYDDEGFDETEENVLYRSTVESSTEIWNPLNIALFVSLTLSMAATTVPVTLLSVMSGDLMGDEDNSNEASSFAARANAAAVLGTSMGKFVNGPAGDVFGARRTSVVYSILLSASLVLLALSRSIRSATWACFLVEFSNSVQWPCAVVILATHYRGSASGMYEGGIYVTSLAVRAGSLLGIPLTGLLLRRNTHWRLVAFFGAWIAMVASSVTYLFVSDSPFDQDDPQNPIDPVQLKKWFPNAFNRQSLGSRNKNSDQFHCNLTFRQMIGMTYFIIRTNFVPSAQHVLRSGTFWIVALAHTGSSMVRTSERVLATYLSDTSNQTMSENQAASYAVFLSLGTVVGLLVAGNAFAGCRQERERKWLVSRLYVTTIGACYVMALLAIPALRSAIHAPALITSMQVMAIFTAGFGIAVQFYHIPSLVGATFGCDKGLFSAYTDGVAYGVASLVWSIVGDAVQHGNASGGGWAYGWAAIALLLIPSAILMVEFMEHYFCRPRHRGTYETIIFA